MLQLLTVTGCRPEAFELCQRWMMNQKLTGKVKWIIVDDGKEPQEITFDREDWDLELIRVKPYWEEGMNTQKRNMLVGLEETSRDYPLAIIEDDDYYGPNWLATVCRHIHKYDLVGEKFAQYYNVKTNTFRQMNNVRSASLCATAVKGDGHDMLVKSCKTGGYYIDLYLWRLFQGKKRLLDTRHVVGIKEMPGRGNIGLGKAMKDTNDKDMTLLRGMIGEDAEHYAQFRA